MLNTELAGLAELARDLRARSIAFVEGPDYIEFTEFINSFVWVIEVRMWSADLTVPCLYFTVYETSLTGTRVLGLHELDVRETIISEHPRTGLPSLFVHPCNTRAWLDDTHASTFLWLAHFAAEARIPLNLTK